MPVDNRITLQKLEVLDRFVELGSVTAAARDLFVSQPVVSAHLRSLEHRLGCQLFYREGRQLRLTEGGQAAHSWAVDVLTRTRELSRHLDNLSDGQQGSVVLAASLSVGSYVLPTVVSRFRRERPRARIELRITDSESALQDVIVGRSDLAVVTLDTTPSSEDIDFEQLGVEELVIVARPDGEPSQAEITVEKLADLPFVESPSGIRRALVDRQLARLGITRRTVVIELGHPEALKRATEEGLGVALLYRCSVRRELADGRLRELVLRGASFNVPIYVLRRRGKLVTAIQSALVEAIRMHVRALGQEVDSRAPEEAHRASVRTVMTEVHRLGGDPAQEEGISASS